MVPAKFEDDMYQIDETAEAILRDTRGFAGPMLRNS